MSDIKWISYGIELIISVVEVLAVMGVYE